MVCANPGGEKKSKNLPGPCPTIIQISRTNKALKVTQHHHPTIVTTRAREIVGFAGSEPIFETENRFISRQEA